MAGFLTHLVQRTLAASPVLAPRLTGRYEGPREASDAPPAHDMGDMPGLAARGQARPDASAPAEGMPQPNATRPRHARAMEADDLDPVLAGMPPDDDTPGLEVADPEVAASLDASPAPRHAGIDAARQAQSAVSPPAPEATPAHPSPADVPNVLPQQPASIPLPVRHQVEVRAAARTTSSAAPETPAPMSNAAASSFVPSVDASPPSHPEPAVAGMLIEPRLPRGGEHSPQHAQAPAAPTIHVTIGRIELRAAAAAPPRGPAKAPTLSLSAYLERRAKGSPA